MYSIADVQNYIKKYKIDVLKENNIKNNHQEKKRIFKKTLNNPQLIDFKLFDNCTSIENPICIISVDQFDWKYVVINDFIFNKANICNIDILKIKNIELNRVTELDFYEYKFISKIVDWVNKVYIAPWGEHKRITKIIYTYPKLNNNKRQLISRETKEEYIKRKNKEIKDSGGKLNSEYIKY